MIVECWQNSNTTPCQKVLEYDSEPEFDLAAGGVGVSSESEVQQTDRFDVADNYGEGRHAR